MAQMRASLWIVRDRNGNAWGPFETNEAGPWARQKWPDQEQDERRTGVGWDIEALRDRVGFRANITIARFTR